MTAAAELVFIMGGSVRWKEIVLEMHEFVEHLIRVGLDHVSPAHHPSNTSTRSEKEDPEQLLGATFAETGLRGGTARSSRDLLILIEGLQHISKTPWKYLARVIVYDEPFAERNALGHCMHEDKPASWTLPRLHEMRTVHPKGI